VVCVMCCVCVCVCVCVIIGDSNTCTEITCVAQRSCKCDGMTHVSVDHSSCSIVSQRFKPRAASLEVNTTLIERYGEGESRRVRVLWEGRRWLKPSRCVPVASHACAGARVSAS
jgi:hypothetical protein